MVFLRRTTEHGVVSLLGRRFEVDSFSSHRLVRCDVDLTAGRIRFYTPRRAKPEHQALLREVPYELPHRPFKE